MNSGSSQSNTFKFQGRHFKKYNSEYIVYEGSISDRPQLSNYVERQIERVSEALENLGKCFSTCIIEKRPWTYFRPCNRIEKGVSVNYIFITSDGSLMWRKSGKSHGTRNKIYTKTLSKYYTFCLADPSIN